jgi:ankyrin repeat protein
MWAAYAGHADIVGVLISTGADVNLTSEAGQSALIRAAGQGHLEIVQMLLEAGADAAAEVDGAGALAWAERNGHTAVGELLQRPGRSR